MAKLFNAKGENEDGEDFDEFREDLDDIDEDETNENNSQIVSIKLTIRFIDVIIN